MSAYQYHPTLAAYEAAPTLSTWVSANLVKEEMLWRNSYQHQVEWMPSLASFSAHSEPRVVATHRSKSIELPVPAILLGNPSSDWVVLMLRDNFYDVNVAVVSNAALSIDYSIVLTEMTHEAYHKEKARALEYMGKDPVTKDRITEAEWRSGAWYEKWASGSLAIEDGKIWRAGRAYAEGISRVPGACIDPYKRDCKAFSVAINPTSEDDVIKFVGDLASAVKTNLNP